MPKRRTFLALLLAAGLAFATALSPSPASYYPHALGDFDGTNDYLTRGAGLTGAVDGKAGLFSCWFRIDGGDGTVRYIAESTAGRTYITLSANKPQIVGRTVVGGYPLVLSANTAILTGATWHHAAFSWDLAAAAGHVYVDDAEDQAAGATLDNNTIDYTVADWAIGSRLTPASYWNGALAEVYFGLEYLDISVESNRRLFIDAAGDPVNLGADGSFPTGTAPIIYMKERANNAGLNFGTGGNFTINGAPLFTEGPVPFFPLTIPAPVRGRGSRMRIH